MEEEFYDVSFTIKDSKNGNETLREVKIGSFKDLKEAIICSNENISAMNSAIMQSMLNAKTLFGIEEKNTFTDFEVQRIEGMDFIASVHVLYAFDDNFYWHLSCFSKITKTKFH